MKYIKPKSSSKGFTLIELVIVIAILGIIAIFALPRIFSLTSSAQTADHDMYVATLNSAINIAHSQWIINGSTGTVSLDNGTAITMNAAGYPDIGVTYNTTTSCLTLLRALMSNANSLVITYSASIPACQLSGFKWPITVNLTPTNAY